jgi:phenylpyruvate tautomerase PptA (4-oxalocrotonate tautomerase family)
MPYIDAKTNVKITNEQKEALIKEFGKAIEKIPGKSEEWLMVNVEGDRTMAFRGDFSPCVMVEIAIFGKASNEAYDALTECVCALTQRILGVPSDRTYVKYTEISHWGYDGFNF